ncbi:MAG: hypothetical protein JRI68_08640 [Deltaproteobacteria bacterium]|nr:hypothetical protein [Deltaproteobacteria bacterium]
MKLLTTTRTTLTLCGATAFAGLLAVACADTETAEPTGPAFASETAFCKAVAEAVCNSNVVSACYGSSDATLPDDTQSCVEQYSRQVNCNPGSFPYDPAGAEGCIAAMTAAYADGAINQTDVENIANACLPVFSSGGAAGSTCDIDSDCDGTASLRCVIKGGEGTCQVPEEITPGQTCGEAQQVCEEGYYCGSDDACIVRPGVAGDCSEIKPCVETALCLDGVCFAKTDNGGTCTVSSECLGGFCVLATGATDGSCGAQYTLSPTTAESCTPFLP